MTAKTITALAEEAGLTHIQGAEDWDYRASERQLVRFAQLVLETGLPARLPVGWKLVPIEPTVEMIRAACSAWPHRPYEAKLSMGDYARADWRAFLAAAPIS